MFALADITTKTQKDCLVLAARAHLRANKKEDECLWTIIEPNILSSGEIFVCAFSLVKSKHAKLLIWKIAGPPSGFG